MLFISSRKDLTDEDATGVDSFWDIRIRSGMSAGETRLPGGLQDIRSAIAGKRTLLLVHGYNNEFSDIVRAFGMVEKKTSRLMSSVYDVVIGYTWPGGDSRMEYFAAKTRSGSLAPRFSANLSVLVPRRSTRPACLDVMTHSMGSRLVLEALNHLNRRNVVRNLYLLGSAVDNECLERGHKYHRASRLVRHAMVFHSRHDRVLSYAYRAAEFDRALGLSGPEDPAAIMQHSPQTVVINCKHHIQAHGDYKGEDEIYRFIAANANRVRSRQFTTL